MGYDIYYVVECGNNYITTNDKKQAIKLYKKYARKGKRAYILSVISSDYGYTEKNITEEVLYGEV